MQGTSRCFEDVRRNYRREKRRRWNLNRNRFVAAAKAEVDAEAEVIRPRLGRKPRLRQRLKDKGMRKPGRIFQTSGCQRSDRCKEPQDVLKM